jgi:hypothetical protein
MFCFKRLIAHNLENVCNFLPPQKKGNSLVEYALPLGILGILIVVGLVSVGPNFQNFLGDSFNGHLGTGADAKALHLQPLGTNPYTGTAVLTLSDGTKIQLAGFPSDIQKLIETLGPNGATDTLSDLLQKLGKALLAAGKITPDEANQLSKLANQGHLLASIQRQYEDAAKESGGDASLFASKIAALKQTREAEQVPANLVDPELANLLDIKQRSVGTHYQLDANNKVLLDSSGEPLYNGSKLKPDLICKEDYDFANALGLVRNTSIFNDPPLRNLVVSLSLNISKLSSSSTAMSNRVTDSRFGLTPDQINQNVSDAIHEHGANLCSVGGGNDSGVQCPKQ